MFQDYYRDRAPEQLAKEFGPQFAQAPSRSSRPAPGRDRSSPGYGWHLVFVDTLVPGRVPAFEEVEPDVKTAWLGEQKALAWQKAYERHAREVHGAAAGAAGRRSERAAARRRRRSPAS